jgi:hypothetical protein
MILLRYPARYLGLSGIYYLVMPSMFHVILYQPEIPPNTGNINGSVPTQWQW